MRPARIEILDPLQDHRIEARPDDELAFQPVVAREKAGGSRRNSPICSDANPPPRVCLAPRSASRRKRRGSRSPAARVLERLLVVENKRRKRTVPMHSTRQATLRCGCCRLLCHCHQDRPIGNSSDQTICLQQLHLPTFPFPIGSSYTLPDRS